MEGCKMPSEVLVKQSRFTYVHIKKAHSSEQLNQQAELLALRQAAATYKNQRDQLLTTMCTIKMFTSRTDWSAEKALRLTQQFAKAAIVCAAD